MVRASASRLEEVVQSRVAALEDYVDARLRLLAPLGRRAGRAVDVGEASKELKDLADELGVRNVVLLDGERRVIAQAHPSVTGEGVGWGGGEGAAAFESVLRTGNPLVMAETKDRDGAVWALGAIGGAKEGAVAIAIDLDIEALRSIAEGRVDLGASVEINVLRRQPNGEPTSLGGRSAAIGPVWTSLLSSQEEPGRGGAGSLELVADDGEPAIAAWAPAPSFNWHVIASVQRSELLAPLANADRAFLLAIAVGASLAVGVALTVTRRVALPLEIALSATRRIASGDLTAPPPLDGEGEARELLRALRDTNQDLVAVVGRMRAASGEIVRSSGTVLSATHEQERVVRDFVSSVSEVARTASQMNSSSRQLSVTMVGLARAAEFAATTATSGRTALVDLGKQMGRLNEGGRNVASRLEAIRDRAARIDSMVAAITKVANQTNLLAVNAAIEAEKAGASGHGFQVVAREIDRLATQTAASVLEIEETVIAVQQAVTEGVVEMSHFIDLVDDGCGTANGVASQMGLIIRQAEELRSEFEQVAHSVEGQSQGVERVHEAMARVAEGAERTKSAVDRSALATSALDDAARGLEADVRHFQLPA